MTYHIQKEFHPGLTQITLVNGNLKATFVDLGARLHQLFVPDHAGKKENILLSHDDPEALLHDQAYFGATVGPVAGRLKNGLWGKLQLQKNAGAHHIHGGANGWSFQRWQYSLCETDLGPELTFTLDDSQSGYPGPIQAVITYRLEKENLILSFSASSIKDTLINPTNHSYFNLSGNGRTDIDTHYLTVAADHILELDHEHIPTGGKCPVKDTPFDFTHATLLSDMLKLHPKGLDDVFVLNKTTPQSHLILQEVTSRRQLTVATTAPSVVLFSTTGFNEELFLTGKKMHSNYGLAIEPQLFPDGINHPEWESIELKQGELFTSQTSYHFSIMN